jgi:hypothetical protein
MDGPRKLYSSLDIMRMMKSRTWWPENVARTGETRNVYKVLVGKPEDGCMGETCSTHG